MFYDQLKKACSKNNTTPSALAKEFGLTTANTGKWKKGGTPKVDILMKFAIRLNVTTDYLLLGKESSDESLSQPITNKKVVIKMFCPFINDVCRKDCVFKSHNTMISPNDESDCLIAIKLADINEHTHSDLMTIAEAIKEQQ